MSAKFEKALAEKRVLIKKTISGEVKINFAGEQKSINVSHNGVIDLLSKRGVTVESLRKSNLKDLVNKQYIRVL